MLISLSSYPLIEVSSPSVEHREAGPRRFFRAESARLQRRIHLVAARHQLDQPGIDRLRPREADPRPQVTLHGQRSAAFADGGRALLPGLDATDCPDEENGIFDQHTRTTNQHADLPSIFSRGHSPLLRQGSDHPMLDRHEGDNVGPPGQAGYPDT